MRIIAGLILASILGTVTYSPVRAQSVKPLASSMPAAADSLTKIYTYVQYMPLYQGEEGTEKLAKDLLREFQAASAAGSCSMPVFLVIVTLTVGPSGVIRDVMTVNNIPSISEDEFKAGKRGIVGARSNLQELPVACEAALVAAAHKLPRLNPGSLNGRRVPVSYTLNLLPITK